MVTQPENIKSNLVFVKLGGSIITDKTKPMTPRLETIQRLAGEIANAVHVNPKLRLLIGHGSGSFGHAVAHQYQTQSGYKTPDYWQGFVRVWSAARMLNQYVMNAFTEAGLPVMAFPPSAAIIAQDRQIKTWDIAPITNALNQGIIPVVQGDVIFDTSLGGTILSTEAVFQYLTSHFAPQKILIAGLESGVYRDYPINDQNGSAPNPIDKTDDIISRITPENFNQILPGLTSSDAVDVTGGMRAKVEMMLSLVIQNPDLRVQIFSGIEPGNLFRVLDDEPLGTFITSEKS